LDTLGFEDSKSLPPRPPRKSLRAFLVNIAHDAKITMSFSGKRNDTKQKKHGEKSSDAETLSEDDESEDDISTIAKAQVSRGMATHRTDRMKTSVSKKRKLDIEKLDVSPAKI